MAAAVHCPCGCPAEALGEGRPWTDTMPHNGWVYVGIVEDLGDVVGRCAMCEREDIRYVHKMRYMGAPHPTVAEGDEIGVGCVCARHMLHNSAAIAAIAVPPSDVAALTKTNLKAWRPDAVPAAGGPPSWSKLVRKGTRMWRHAGAPAGRCTLHVVQAGAGEFRIQVRVMQARGRARHAARVWDGVDAFPTRAVAMAGFVRLPRGHFGV